jgi:predicted NUDIX family phosphoesterase
MDAAKALEHVLVIPESHFHSIGFFRGFRSYSPNYFQSILDAKQFSFRSRNEVETDPSFKQLIPYLVLRWKDQLFHYTRGKSGTEKRLQALRSVGIGGHISQEDSSVEDAYRQGMLRELHEEIDLQTSFQEKALGFIYDDRTPVGSVHLGVVHLFDLLEPKVSPKETAISECGFTPLTELIQQKDHFETWSQFVFEELHRCE